jgi:chemotaxis signal transduction protein
MNATELTETLWDMRRSFDDTFAHPYKSKEEASEHALAIRLRGDAYLLRLTMIAGLINDRPILPTPSPLPALLGLCGHRGIVMPVYDLGLLLGYPATPTPPRWIAVLRQADAVAVAFDDFDAQQQLPVQGESTPASPAPTQPRRHLAGVIRTDTLRSLVDLASVYEAIHRDVAGTKRREPAGHSH